MAGARLPEQPPEIPDEERARVTRALMRRLQWGGAVFLVVVSLGTVPALVQDRWPALARYAAVAVWVLAPLLGLAFIVVAAIRMRR